MKQFLVGLMVLTLAVPAVAMGEKKTEPDLSSPLVLNKNSASQIPKDTDPLNSWTDGRTAKCSLKQEEREWLQKAVDNGELRLATKEDIEAWERKAKSKGRPNHEFKMDCGRTYAILKPITIPKMVTPKVVLSGNITFFVPAGVAFPRVDGWSAVIDANTGGWYQGGSYDDGEREGTGSYPSDPQTPKWLNDDRLKAAE